MSNSVNKVLLIGNCCSDPEVRSFQDGRQVCNLRLATSETWRDKASGERKERSEFHSVAIFNENLVKVAQQYLRKGSKCFIEGQLQSRKWTDASGADRYTTEIVLQNYNGQLVLLDKATGNTQSENRSSPPQSRQNSTQAPANRYPGRASHTQTTAPKEPWDLDDEVPFCD